MEKLPFSPISSRKMPMKKCSIPFENRKENINKSPELAVRDYLDCKM